MTDDSIAALLAEEPSIAPSAKEYKAIFDGKREVSFYSANRLNTR